jgi:hypothetical protein
MMRKLFIISLFLIAADAELKIVLLMFKFNIKLILANIHFVILLNVQIV